MRDAFNKLNEVIISCFSYELLPDYNQKIKELQSLYMKLGISETPKAHILFDDVPRFLASKDHGLGIYRLFPCNFLSF